MEDLTLALITLTSFVLLFVVAIFADRAGVENEVSVGQVDQPVAIPVDERRAAVAATTAVDVDVA